MDIPSHCPVPTSSSAWDPGWGHTETPPSPSCPPGCAGAGGSPPPLPSRPGASSRNAPKDFFPPPKRSPEPRCEGQPARGEFKASSACESQGRFSPGERFPEEEACQEPQARRGLTTITKTSRTWLEIKRLPSLLSKTAGVALRAWAFSPSKHPPLLRPSEAPPCFHVSISAPSLLARKIQN